MFASTPLELAVVSVRLRGHGRISLKRKIPLAREARSDGLPPDASSASAFGFYELRLTLHPEA